MVISESYNIALSLATFSKDFSKAAFKYFSSDKPYGTPRGTNLDRPLPAELPSILEIKKVIPPICFQPEVSTSMYHAIKDVFIALVCFVFFFNLIAFVDNFTLKLPLMAIYLAIQGTIFTGIFVVGHDCGHGSFSNYSLINDIVGSFLHSFLMVPYFMWKLTHRHHHKNTSNLEKDEVFYPVRSSEDCSSKHAPPIFGLGSGWYGYLISGYNPRPVSHFNVAHPMYAGHLVGCTFSLIGMATMCVLLYQFYTYFGLLNLIIFYLIPDFIFASYLVIITFLHHSEFNIPWYSDEKWSFVKGQLSSVDRHYGLVHNLLHNIGTHQIHHLFPMIPHYHLELATEHFRKHFPSLVKTCDEPIISSFFRMFKAYDTQAVVDDDAEEHCYHNK